MGTGLCCALHAPLPLDTSKPTSVSCWSFSWFEVGRFTLTPAPGEPDQSFGWLKPDWSFGRFTLELQTDQSCDPSLIGGNKTARSVKISSWRHNGKLVWIPVNLQDPQCGFHIYFVEPPTGSLHGITRHCIALIVPAHFLSDLESDLWVRVSLTEPPFADTNSIPTVD